MGPLSKMTEEERKKLLALGSSQYGQYAGADDRGLVNVGEEVSKVALAPLAALSGVQDVTNSLGEGDFKGAAMTAAGWTPIGRLGGPLLSISKDKLGELSKKRLDELAKAKKEWDMEDLDMAIHSSPSGNLSIDDYRFRPVNVPNKPSSGKGNGIFTHGVLDADKYNDYGANKYGVLYNKKAKTYSNKIDDMDDRGETFITEDDVYDIIPLYTGDRR